MPLDVLVCLAVLREEYGPGARVFFRRVLHYEPQIEIVVPARPTVCTAAPPAVMHWLRTAHPAVRYSSVSLDQFTLNTPTEYQWQTPITTP